MFAARTVGFAARRFAANQAAMIAKPLSSQMVSSSSEPPTFTPRAALLLPLLSERNVSTLLTARLPFRPEPQHERCHHRPGEEDAAQLQRDAERYPPEYGHHWRPRCPRGAADPRDHGGRQCLLGEGERNVPAGPRVQPQSKCPAEMRDKENILTPSQTNTRLTSFPPSCSRSSRASSFLRFRTRLES